MSLLNRRLACERFWWWSLSKLEETQRTSQIHNLFSCLCFTTVGPPKIKAAEPIILDDIPAKISWSFERNSPNNDEKPLRLLPPNPPVFITKKTQAPQHQGAAECDSTRIHVHLHLRNAAVVNPNLSGGESGNGSASSHQLGERRSKDEWGAAVCSDSIMNNGEVNKYPKTTINKHEPWKWFIYTAFTSVLRGVC